MNYFKYFILLVIGVNAPPKKIAEKYRFLPDKNHDSKKDISFAKELNKLSSTYRDNPFHIQFKVLGIQKDQNEGIVKLYLGNIFRFIISFDLSTLSSFIHDTEWNQNPCNKLECDILDVRTSSLLLFPLGIIFLGSKKWNDRSMCDETFLDGCWLRHSSLVPGEEYTDEELSSVASLDNVTLRAPAENENDRKDILLSKLSEDFNSLLKIAKIKIEYLVHVHLKDVKSTAIFEASDLDKKQFSLNSYCTDDSLYNVINELDKKSPHYRLSLENFKKNSKILHYKNKNIALKMIDDSMDIKKGCSQINESERKQAIHDSMDLEKKKGTRISKIENEKESSNGCFC